MRNSEFLKLKQKIIDTKVCNRLVFAKVEGEYVWQTIEQVARMQFCFPILVGNEKSVLQQIKQYKIDRCEVINAVDDNDAAKKSVKLIFDKKADILVKGNIHTDILLRAVLNKEFGLKKNRILSHIMVFELNNGKLLAVTDSGMVIQPMLQEKIEIINNAVSLFKKFDIQIPRVAALSAVEKINENILGSIDAAVLSVMAIRGQIKDVIIDGPISFDLALSAEARKIKNIDESISSDADILLVPDVVCGNVLGKALTYCAKYQTASLILGASCPIILTSRAGTTEERINSIILGMASCF